MSSPPSQRRRTQPTLAELEADPHPWLARLRAHGPVTWVEALGGWVVTGFDEAAAVMRDDATFTVDDPRFSTARVVGPSMLSLDGVAHARHRDPFAATFRPAEIRRRFSAIVEAEVDRLVSVIEPMGRAELRTQVAAPLAVAVMAAALGLAGTDTRLVLGWYRAIVRAVDEASSGRPIPASGADAFAALRAHVESSMAAADETSVLVAASRGEDRLGVAEVVSNAAVLMFGGIETTEGMIANAALHLLSHPDQLALVQADPSALDGAIEESLRLEPAAAVVDRYATRSATIGEARIGAGDLVVVSLAGANRDPAVFADPDRFDVLRPNAARHLAFAQGPHYCLGVHLARLETSRTLSSLLTRLPRLRLEPELTSSPRGLIFRKPPAVTATWG